MNGQSDSKRVWIDQFTEEQTAHADYSRKRSPGNRWGLRSKALFEQVGSEDKTLRLYDYLRHEIFNKPEYQAVMADMEDWLNQYR